MTDNLWLLRLKVSIVVPLREWYVAQLCTDRWVTSIDQWQLLGNCTFAAAFNKKTLRKCSSNQQYQYHLVIANVTGTLFNFVLLVLYCLRGRDLQSKTRDLQEIDPCYQPIKFKHSSCLQSKQDFTMSRQGLHNICNYTMGISNPVSIGYSTYVLSLIDQTSTYGIIVV